MEVSERASDQLSRSVAARMLLSAVVILPATAAVLSVVGRRLWCACGSFRLWSWDIWSRHNSQHLVDPYFFSHVLHGMLFWALLTLCCRSRSLSTRFCLALLIEAAWEILENSPVVIDRYRANTIALDYTGDSIANSLADLLACAAGFLLARRLSLIQGITVFVAVELMMVVTIRDSLLLNVLMLLMPLEAIRQWQSAGSPACCVL